MLRRRAALWMFLTMLCVGLLVFWGTRPWWAPQASGPAQVVERVQGRGPATSVRGAAYWAERSRELRRRPAALPHISLPGPSEAPYPRGPATDALARLLDADDSDRASAERDFLAAARTARLDASDPHLVDDPWRALLALEAERRRATDEGIGIWFVSLARALVRSEPDGVVADHARLYLLHGLSDPTWDTVDSDRRAEAALEAVTFSTDALVQAVAVAAIADSTERAEDLLPHLENLWEGGGRDPWFAAAALDLSLAVRSPDQVRTWLGRLEDGVLASCPQPSESARCRSWRREVTGGWSQLDALDAPTGEGATPRPRSR